MNDNLFEYLLSLRYQLEIRLDDLRKPKELNFSEHSDIHDEITSIEARLSLISTIFNEFGDNQ